MPRGNLLRHLFRNSPHTGNRPHEQSPYVNEAEESTVIKSEDPSQTLSRPRTSEPPGVHVLPRITEEEPISSASIPLFLASSAGSAGSDVASFTTILDANVPAPALAIDPATLTTRDLLYAAIDEATAAVNTHIDTLETTLALLRAISGFSETVEVLKREMEDKKRECKIKLGELEGFEEGVAGMKLLGDETC
ncbi:hypothetical protein ACET3X_000225 [Alternaria dauci]|uniref:Uncharacterized protein n=1 Tax=Alternaria dauci TaxID=48095 RepID=A0ABR3UTX8_9PLEO